MGITSHGPANPAIHHPRSWEAEQHWRRSLWALWSGVCGGIPAHPGTASGKEHWVGSWDMNQKSCSYCCKCFELCFWSWDGSSTSWSQCGFLSAGKHMGLVPQGYQCPLDVLSWGGRVRGEGSCVYREFLCSKENLKWLVGTYWQWDDFQGTSC